MGTRRQWLLAGAAAILALAGLAAAALRHRSSSPGQWDPRLLPIVHFVEQEQGRRFRHPVAVDLLAPDRFQAVVGANRPPSPADLAALDRSLAEPRALGLVSGPVDLRALAAQLAMDDVVGVYQPATKHVYVRGTALTPDVRVTLAHELTHALQDQEVDLAGLERLQGEAGSAARATIEGDAVVVEQAYAATLSAADAGSYRRERAADATGGASPANPGGPGGPGAGQFPVVLSDRAAFPYVFGPTFIRAVRQQGGPAQVDRALRRPPRTEAEIVDPDLWLQGFATAAVPFPHLASGDRASGAPSSFGQVSLFEVLGTRDSYQQAWNAVLGWRGARAVTYRRGGSTCVAMVISFAAQDQTDRFVIAAGDWAETVPGATVKGQGLTAEVRSCDPGPAARPPAPVEPPPFQVLSLRASIIGLFLDRKAAVGPSACAADQLIARVSPTELIAYDDGEASPGVAQAITAASRQALTACKG